LNVRRVVFSDTGALRAPWRVILFFLTALACSLVASLALGPPVARVFRVLGASAAADQWLQCAALLAATAIMVRRVDRRRWTDVSLDSEAARPRFLVQGFLIGALAIGLPTLLLIALGWLRAGPGSGAAWGGAVFRVTLILLPAAFTEELLTRGYVFAVLRQSLGWKWTILATSVVFGLLHLRNEGVNAESLVLVTLAGVFLGGVLLATRSLYAAWMAHFAWNWTMAAVFHTAVSGYPLDAPGYRYVDAGPDWATGGVWGPEGGAPAGLGMGLGAGLAYLFARRNRSSS